METKPQLTTYTRISLDAMPVHRALASLCTVDGMQERIFHLILALLRDQIPDTAGLPSEAIDAIPRLRALDRHSLEMVGYFYGDVEATSINSHPVFVAQDTLAVAHANKENPISEEDIRRSIDNARQREAPIPKDLPPACREAVDVMDMLHEDFIRQIEQYFFEE